MKTAKIFFETYGCSYNQEDTNIMLGLVRAKSRYEIAKNEKEADIIVLNGCVVKNPTEHKIIARIKALEKAKKKVIVAGCFAENNAERYKNNTLLGAKALERINDAIESAIKNENTHFLNKETADKCGLISVEKTAKQILPIQIIPVCEGCLGNCAYCATKAARGNLKSFSKKNIIEAMRKGIDNGTKEFWITAQDIGCYGLDLGTNIVELLNKILEEFKTEKIFIRLGMINPNFARKYLNELIEIYKNEKMFKFLHIPLQSGNDRVLKLMNRKYTVSDFVFVVERFKENIPDMTIATDIIIGFPTETEKEFQDSYDLIEKIKPDVLNRSRFWSKRNTAAEKLEQVDNMKIMQRSKKMHDLFDRLSKENNKRWLGWQGSVYLDELGKNRSLVGRNFAYKNVVIARSGKYKLGDVVDVTIVKTSGYYLSGKSVN